MPQLIPIRAAATDWCVPTTVQRISFQASKCPVHRQQRLAVAPGIRSFTPLGSFCRRAFATICRAGGPDILFRPSTAVHRTRTIGPPLHFAASSLVSFLHLAQRHFGLQ